VAAPAESLSGARVALVRGGETQTLRIYSHPSLGGGEYFCGGGDTAFADRRVQAASEGREGIPGNANVQTQPPRAGATLGGFGAALQFDVSKSSGVALPWCD